MRFSRFARMRRRGISARTVRERATSFSEAAEDMGEREGYVFLDQLRPAALTQFRTLWKNGSATSRRKHERLVAFFGFCVRMEWLDKNPDLLLKRVKVESNAH
jgi:integrase/recombinase XerD